MPKPPDTRDDLILRLTGQLAEAHEALRGAVIGMEGGFDDSRCHAGISTRDECAQCQRVDAVRAALPCGAITDAGRAALRAQRRRASDV